jgi:hypothetical protein
MWFFNGILNWDLFLYFGHTRRQMESLMFAHGKLEVVIFLVIWRWRITSDWRRRVTSKVHVSTWEPCKFCTWLEWPVRIWLLIGISYFLSSETGKIVIASTRLIEICTHCLNEFLLTCAIKNPTLCRMWVRYNRSIFSEIARMSHIRILVTCSLLSLINTLDTRFDVSWFGPGISLAPRIRRHFMGELLHLVFLKAIRLVKYMFAAIIRDWRNSNYVVGRSFRAVLLVV